MGRIEKIEKIAVSLPPSLSVIEPDQDKGKEYGEMGKHRFQAVGKAETSGKKRKKFGKKEQTGGFDDKQQTVAVEEPDNSDQKHAPPGVIRFQKSPSSHARPEDEKDTDSMRRAVKRPGKASFHSPEHKKSDEKRPEHILAVRSVCGRSQNALCSGTEKSVSETRER